MPKNNTGQIVVRRATGWTICGRSKKHRKSEGNKGFGLLELAIVLVIIGLIVGGILVGQDIIAAAAVRAQIAQIDKYQSAASAFETKYGYLPGDIGTTAATSFGFASRGSYAGEGDGNGVIEGTKTNTASNNAGFYELVGETSMFWSDLTYANGMYLNMIEGSFATAQNNGWVVPSTLSNVTGTVLGNYFPQAKIGRGNYVYVWSGGTSGGNDHLNYFGVSAISTVNSTNYGAISSSPGITVSEAYAIDNKIDDGLPQSGNVFAEYLNYSSPNGIVWTDGTYGSASQASTAGSSSTCYDNSSTANATQKYSMEESQGRGLNCALSFRFTN